MAKMERKLRIKIKADDADINDEAKRVTGFDAVQLQHGATFEGEKGERSSEWP
jgi:hypothetical protein